MRSFRPPTQATGSPLAKPCDFCRIIGYHATKLEGACGLKHRFLIPALVLASLSACGPNYTPDTYDSSAAQKENKVDQGTIVGVRPVGVSADSTAGTVTGAAAGGLAGAQVGTGAATAFSALGGSVVGGIAGATVEHLAGDTKAYEYIVHKTVGGDLISVTQNDKTPLTIGQKVLVIAGNQARIVPDYTVALPASSSQSAKTAAAETKPADGKPADGKPADTQPAASPSTTGAAATPAATTPATPAPGFLSAPAGVMPSAPATTVVPAPQEETKPAAATTTDSKQVPDTTDPTTLRSLLQAVPSAGSATPPANPAP
jgi:outer membrane lipoprotein SlyB